ncbi:hypothetical protein K1719_012028 [Acacia pycnantha]|nr:hypothetical protein K1719_012028 [Acacia pycnantha]
MQLHWPKLSTLPLSFPRRSAALSTPSFTVRTLETENEPEWLLWLNQKMKRLEKEDEKGETEEWRKVHVFESNGVNGETEESPEMDDNYEKYLLSRKLTFSNLAE